MGLTVTLALGEPCPLGACVHSGSWHEHPRRAFKARRHAAWLLEHSPLYDEPWVPESARVGPDDEGRSW